MNISPVTSSLYFKNNAVKEPAKMNMLIAQTPKGLIEPQQNEPNDKDKTKNGLKFGIAVVVLGALAGVLMGCIENFLREI